MKQWGVQIITTPTEAWIRDNVRRCHRRFFAASPYVTGALGDILGDLDPSVSSTLLTKTDLRDFAVGASDLDSICALAANGTSIKSLHGLHAKVYIVDDAALVTSANATSGGLRHNRECGVAIEEPSVVADLFEIACAGFGAAEPPQAWRARELQALRRPVSLIRSALPPVPAGVFAQPSDLRIALATEEQQAELLSSLSGWTALTLRGILRHDSDRFSLDSLFAACEPDMTTSYPRNQYKRAKLRQQLQRLRDMGLVEFLGGGRYSSTISTAS